jgi:hypothetical protein
MESSHFYEDLLTLQLCITTNNTTCALFSATENTRSLYTKYAPKATVYANKAVLEENGYRCPVCRKMVAYRYTLLEHMVTHTKEKPFRCAFCVAEFTRRDSLNQHINKVHPETTGIEWTTVFVWRVNIKLTMTLTLNWGEPIVPYRSILKLWHLTWLYWNSVTCFIVWNKHDLFNILPQTNAVCIVNCRYCDVLILFISNISRACNNVQQVISYCWITYSIQCA